MARALIVGCGCRGRALGGRLMEAGWQVRGTSRSEERLGALEDAGIEPLLADPTRPGSVVDGFAGVAVVAWLMGTASGDDDTLAALHGPMLEAVLEELVDSGARAFLYEAGGSVPAQHLRAGAEKVEAAGERWSIPVAAHRHDPFDHSGWIESAFGVVEGLIRR